MTSKLNFHSKSPAQDVYWLGHYLYLSQRYFQHACFVKLVKKKSGFKI